MPRSDQSEQRSQNRHTLAGGVWTVAERIISQVSQFAVFVAAARILSPAEFGIFALVSTCALLLVRVAEVAWAPFIMSWGGDEIVPRQVLMFAVLTGAAVGLLGTGAGLVLPVFGVGQSVGTLTILFSIWVFIATVSSAQKGVMIWRDGLRGSAIAESVGEVIGMVVALLSLWAGHGVFSLAFGRLAYQSTHLAISFAMTRMMPLPGLRGEPLRALIAYSGQIFSSRMIMNLRLYIATFIIGGFLGPAAVGYFRAAQRLVGAVAEIIGAPSLVIAWSMFRAARDRHDGKPTGFQAQANIYFPILLGVAAPVFLWLVLMGEDLISGLLGPKWLPALPIVAILAIARGLLVPSAATEPILSLSGEVRRLPLFSAALLIVTVVLTTIGAWFGLYAVAWSQVAVGGVVAVASNRLVRKYGHVHWSGVMAASRPLWIPMLLGAGTMLLLKQTLLFQAMPALVRAVVITVPSTMVYLSALGIASPRLRAMVLSRLHRLLPE